MQFASFSFDAAVSEVFTALLCGARLVIPSAESRLSLTLSDYIRDRGITTATLPPALLATLPTPTGAHSLHTIITAGEACPADVITKWAKV